jgi:tRNA(Ile)-lysidine synthase
VTLQSVERSKVKFDDTGSRLYIDAEKCRFPMVLRNWQPGDRFQPLGMSGLKKVKDFLTDRKIFGEAKKDALVLESNGDIVALPGIAVSERYKIKSSTKRILKIEIESL